MRSIGAMPWVRASATWEGLSRRKRRPPWRARAGGGGELGHVHDGEAGILQGFRGAAGGDQVGAVAAQGGGLVDQAGLVGNGDQGAADFEGGGHGALRFGSG